MWWWGHHVSHLCLSTPFRARGSGNSVFVPVSGFISSGFFRVQQQVVEWQLNEVTRSSTGETKEAVTEEEEDAVEQETSEGTD